MPALKNQNIMEGTYSPTFYMRKFGNGFESDGKTVLAKVRRATRFGTYFGHVSCTEGSKPFSKSLTDLTRMERELESLPREVNPWNLNAKVFSSMQFQWTESKTAREAGRRVTHLLVLHAWRCRRLAAKRSGILVSELCNQVEGLNMQVYALRQLLENDKTRRHLTIKEMRRNKIEYERERILILQEKETLERKLEELLGSVTELKEESENRKNNFEAAKTEAEFWESRYMEEKEISRALEDQNLILQQENQAKDEKIVHQNLCLTELNRRQTELEEELDSYKVSFNGMVDQINSLQEKLALSEKLGQQQERFLMGKDEDINQLRAQIELMEVKFQEQNEKNGELGKLISDKTRELILLQDKLGELTKNQRFWGNRVIKMVSICTRIPIACFYTVATLLLPQPSYRSM